MGEGGFVRGSARGFLALFIGLSLFGLMALWAPTSYAGTPAAPFSPGTADGLGDSAALLPNGNFVTAWHYAVTSTTDYVRVCVLPVGATKCSSKAALKPPSGATVFEAPQVFSTGSNHVSVVAETCCVTPNEQDMLYNSTDGGKTFSAGVNIGSIDVGTGANIGTTLVWATSVNTFGTFVQSASSTATTPVAGKAHISSDQGPTIMTIYKQGVLVATTALNGSNSAVDVFYAPKGSDFNKTSSYSKVGHFKNTNLDGISGPAILLTPNGTGVAGTPNVKIFNGTSFASGITAPVAHAADDQQYTDFYVNGKVHVFYVDARQSYDLLSESWRPGSTTWSGTTNYPPWKANSTQAVIATSGTGIVLGTPAGSGKVWVQPIGSW